MGSRKHGKVSGSTKQKPNASNKLPPLASSQNFSVDNTSGHCTYRDDIGPCECEEYSEDNTPGQTGPRKCRECGHGRSKHKGPQQKPKVRNIVEELVAAKFGGLEKMSNFQNAEKEANNGLRPKSRTVKEKVQNVSSSTYCVSY
jgi:hypothetical protein